MYCSVCGTQIAPGLSFCNRCGASLKDRSANNNTAAISAFLTAVTVIGVAGLGLLFFGAMLLKRKAQLDEQFIGIFMLFTFLLVGTVEFMLLRQLSKLIGSREEQKALPPPMQPMHELRTASAAALAEPLPSVTENTTRTLEYVRREQMK